MQQVQATTAALQADTTLAPDVKAKMLSSLADSFAESSAEAAVSRQPRPAVLKVIRAEAAEMAEHEAYLDALDKAGGGPCAWRAQAGGESA